MLRTLVRSALLALTLATSLAAQTIRAGNGTAALPSITSNSDLTRGMFFPAANTIGWATSALQTMTLSGGASATLTGGAGNMTITAGTGASRQLQLNITNSSGTVRPAFIANDAGGASQRTTLYGDTIIFANPITSSGPALIRGDAGNLTIRAGTGASRTLTLQTTSSGSAAQTNVTLNADRSVTVAGDLSAGGGVGGSAGFVASNNGTATAPTYRWGGSTATGMFRRAGGSDTISFTNGGAASLGITGGASTVLLGGAGNMTIRSGTGASRTLTLQSTTAGGTAIDIVIMNAIGQAKFRIGSDANPGISSQGDTTVGFKMGSGTISGSIAAVQAFEFTRPTTERTRLSTPLDTLEFTANGASIFARGFADTLIVVNKAKAPALTAAAGTPNTVCINAATKEITENAATDCTVSSARFKTNIQPIDGVYATRSVMAMQGVSFTMRDGGRRALGVIAEKMDSIDARLTFKSADGRVNSYDQSGTIALLIATVQQQQHAIAQLQRQVDALQKGQR